MKNIKPEDVLDFFFNPFSITAKFKTYTFQKYQKSQYVDHIIYMDHSKGTFHNIAYVHYGLGKLFVDKAMPLGLLMIVKEVSIDLDEIRGEVFNLGKDIIKETVEIEKKEIEESKDYKRIYDHYDRRVYDKILFSMFGTNKYSTSLAGFTDFKLNGFCTKLDVLDLIDVYEGKFSSLRKYAKEVVFSDEFISSELIVPKFIKKAEDYIKAGIFSEREERLIYYLDKIKEIKCEKFSVENLYGKRCECRNQLSYEGKLFMIEASFLKLDFEDVKKIEVDGEVVYEKKELPKVKERVAEIIASGSLLS